MVIKKDIARVVRSTLSAEAVALGSTLDRLSWIRIFWKWMKNPGVDWSDPDMVLSKSPQAVVATDCKLVFDISTKTSTPSCTEHRTTLECLLIRERLAENCRLRWLNSRAMLADCLTKSMDGEILRRALDVGKYSLYDENKILQERADKRSRLKWVSQGDTSKQGLGKDISDKGYTGVICACGCWVGFCCCCLFCCFSCSRERLRRVLRKKAAVVTHQHIYTSTSSHICRSTSSHICRSTSSHICRPTS